MTIDIKDFYLNTPMTQSKYMRLNLSELPETAVQQYNIEVKSKNEGYVHVETQRGIYGLLQ